MVLKLCRNINRLEYKPLFNLIIEPVKGEIFNEFFLFYSLLVLNIISRILLL